MLARLTFAAVAFGVSSAAAPAPELAYQVAEGRNLNAFVRDGPVAAHVVLRSGHDPRIVVAFPAGNSGVALLFKAVAGPLVWRLDAPPRPETLADAKGQRLSGINATVSASASSLIVGSAVLSSVRVIRDHEYGLSLPAGVAVDPITTGNTVVWRRDRVDGAPGYLLRLTITDGARDGTTIRAGADGRIAMRVEAATGDPPLTPLAGPALLKPNAANDPAARRTLEFLSYREKFLAGSWHFNTYFGRDTLMSLRMLMPVLQPQAVEAGLSSVLARLAPDGEAAHEESLSEYAVIEHRKARDGLGDQPTLDHGMIDTSFMLAPVLGHYLLDTTDGRARAHAYLAAHVPGTNETAAAALIRNLRFVLAATKPFAADPRAPNLVAIKPGRTTGDWRDSGEGLGRGRFPYDVNAAFVPASLDAIDRMTRAGLLDDALTTGDRADFAHAGAIAAIWRAHAAPLFAVNVSGTAARAAVTHFAAAQGVPDAPALAALGDAPLRFHALSLNADGSPVPIVNSDEGFALLFGDPAPADAAADVRAILRPFPAGLMTDAGLLVANPVLAAPEAQARFTRNAYHGEVIWSWQQALLAAGLARQAARPDLPAPVRAELQRAQATLWRAIAATRIYANSELWSWTYVDGRYKAVPFGAAAGDVTESDAAQLWSTVYLAVRPPALAREEAGHR